MFHRRDFTTIMMNLRSGEISKEHVVSLGAAFLWKANASFIVRWIMLPWGSNRTVADMQTRETADGVCAQPRSKQRQRDG